MAVATNLGLDLLIRIFSTLDNDAALIALVGADKIFDHVPDFEVFPLVVIGDTSATAFHTHTFEGFEGTIQIRVWTQSDAQVGKKQVLDIMGAIWTALNNVELSVPNRKQINFRCETQDIILEEDNRTYQGQMNFDYKYGGNDT